MAHADEFETSLYLHLAPERVRMDQAVADNDVVGRYMSSDSTLPLRAFQRLLGPLDEGRRAWRSDRGHGREGQDHLGGRFGPPGRAGRRVPRLADRPAQRPASQGRSNPTFQW